MLKTSLRRRIGAALIVTTVALAGNVLFAGPAAAVEQIIDRGLCRYRAELLYYATTSKVNGSCSGHAWVRVKIGGVWGGWVHDPDRARIAPPLGRPIQQSQHKTCSDCAVITLTAS